MGVSNSAVMNRNTGRTGNVDRRGRHPSILRTLLRALTTATLLLAVYYVVPMDTAALDVRGILVLIGCLLAFVALVVWQLRAIIQSEYPGLRAIETLSSTVPLYILGFATAYFLAQNSNSANFSQSLTRTDALYFSVTVLSTVGFGDITAKTDPARLIVTAQMFFDLILLGFGARVFIGAVERGRRRRSQPQPPE